MEEMDLQHPLRSLVPSRDWAVLEVLAATQSGLGASQIARLSHAGSRSGQATILDRLVEQGLVIAEPAPLGFLYRLNRDHLLAPAVLQAAGLRSVLLERLREAVEQLSPGPVHASVFGSFARGEANDDSDIDILLIARSDQDVADWNTQIDQLDERVQLWTGNRCSCMSFSVERALQLVKQKEPIVDGWVNDGLILIGDPVQDILGVPAHVGVRRAKVAGARR
jgi:predicted nucleotidyltransferase